MKADERERVNIFGILLDRVDYSKACQRVETFLKSYGNRIIVTPNAEIIMAARKAPELKAVLNEADICLPDGIGVVIASRILGKPLTERTTGFDFMMKVLEMADKKELSLFLLGGKPGVAEKAGKKIKMMFPGINIAGFHHGYFKDDQEIVYQINDKKPDIIVVAMLFP